jgi:hypothetical protein
VGFSPQSGSEDREPDVTAAEKSDLVAFLKTLDGAAINVAAPTSFPQ